MSEFTPREIGDEETVEGRGNSDRSKKKSHRERGSGKLKKRKQGVLASAKRGCKLLR